MSAYNKKSPKQTGMILRREGPTYQGVVPDQGPVDDCTDFAFNLVEHCLGGLTHPREAAWDRILALTHQLIAAHRALEYELRRSGPFSADEVEYLLQTHYPDSMLLPDEEQYEGSTEGKRRRLRVPLGQPDFLGGADQ